MISTYYIGKRNSNVPYNFEFYEENYLGNDYYTFNEKNYFPFNKITFTEIGMKIPVFFIRITEETEIDRIKIEISDQPEQGFTGLDAFRDADYGEGYCSHVTVQRYKSYELKNGVPVESLYKTEYIGKTPPTIEEMRNAAVRSIPSSYLSSNTPQLMDIGINNMLSLLYAISCTYTNDGEVPNFPSTKTGVFGEVVTENEQQYGPAIRRNTQFFKDTNLTVYNSFIGIREFLGNTSTYIDRVEQKDPYNSNIWLYKTPEGDKEFTLTDNERIWGVDNTYTIPDIGWTSNFVIVQDDFNMFRNRAAGGRSNSNTYVNMSTSISGVQKQLNNRLYIRAQTKFNFEYPIFYSVNLSPNLGYRYCSRVKRRRIEDFDINLKRSAWNKISWNVPEENSHVTLYKDGREYFSFIGKKEFTLRDDEYYSEYKVVVTNSDITDYNSYEFESNKLRVDAKGFVIDLYNNQSENNRVNKSLDFIDSIHGILRDECDILNPVILFEYPFENDFPNYIYIPMFKRYYFITDYTVVRNNLWRVYCKVDVLMSYSSSIKELSGVIARNEYEFDDMIIDDLVPSKLEYYVDRIGYDQWRIVFGDNRPLYTLSGLTYVINCYALDADGTPIPPASILDSPTIANGSHIYLLTPEQFKTFTDVLYDPDLSLSLGKMFTQGGMPNLSEAIFSINILPLNILQVSDYLDELGITLVGGVDDDNVNNRIRLGKTVLPYYCSGYKVSPSSRIKIYSPITEGAEIRTINSFLKQNPYSKYYLHFPYIGTYEIPSQYIQNRDINCVVYDIDLGTGDFICSLSNTTPSRNELVTNCHNIWKGNMFIAIPVSRTNKTELQRQAVQLTANTAIQFATGIASLAAMAANPLAGAAMTAASIVTKAGMISNIAKSGVSAITDFAPKVSHTNLIGSSVNGKIFDRPIFMFSIPRYYYPDNYNHSYGKPLNQYRKLSNMFGFTAISEIHLEGIPCTSTELTEIEQLLLSGVLFEQKATT